MLEKVKKFYHQKRFDKALIIAKREFKPYKYAFFKGGGRNVGSYTDIFTFQIISTVEQKFVNTKRRRFLVITT